MHPTAGLVVEHAYKPLLKEWRPHQIRLVTRDMHEDGSELLEHGMSHRDVKNVALNACGTRGCAL